ncbi:MAG TPA: translation initiation factor IF-3 [Candidatus Atribacteria bacterium]|nr:translation initiation factor IF-3 [Candidatus Atribacteria bacterium]HPT78835.1 translation initiation factor IF-3 [Candidatus Atribacteria bacterium]
MSNKELSINEQIREKEVRVIDTNGDQLGIMPTKKALELAEQKQLDLVLIAPQANPPVCKIMDYGKYKFEIAKREKEARKNQRTITIKEVRLSAAIEEHDMSVKAKNAEKFLKAGDKVKVSIRFRGREMAHREIGYEVMEKFNSMLSRDFVIERQPRIEGRSMIMVLAPKE